LGKFKIKKQTFQGRAKDKDVDTDTLVRTAERISKLAGTTAIYLARPGLDGSSGFHGIRHSVLELEVVNAALDAIKQRHGYQVDHLFVQARDQNRHCVSVYAHMAVAECVRGTPTAEISLKLATAAAKRAARSERDRRPAPVEED